MLFHSHSVPSQRRGWRIVRVLVCLALLLHGLLPLAAVAREPVEALPTRPNQPTQQLTSAEPLQPAAINAPQAVGIVATKRDAFATDADSDGLGDANDVVRYTVIITNTGSTDATGVAFNDTLDDDSALVAGSVRVSPLARPDVFNTVGNTQLLVGIAQPANVPALAVAGNLFTNDSEFLGDTFSLQSFSATSANGGTVVVNAAGTFSYLPPVGFIGTDTFNYTIVDGGGLTSVGTVTITVANRVWYVNNAGANGDGRSTTPFNTLALAQAASAINDVIFVHTGSGNYASITLKNGQQLIGRGVALIVGGNTLLAAGTAPTLSATGTLVTLAQNNTVRGMTITSQTSGLGISGTSFGTATINAVALNGGPALSLTTGTLNGDFSTLSSSGGAFGVALTSVDGALTATAGTISGISGTDFSISAGTIAVTYPGSITNTTGRSIVVESHATGAIGFGGAINDTGTGILIQNNTSGTISLSNASKTFNTGANPAITMITNTGATVEFTGGGLSVTTSSGTGMNITGGGTLRVSGTGNSITSTAGQAINMVNTTSGGITFQSVSANISGGIGITLNTVGTGGFTVTGTGTTDGSGGTIQNTNRGIEISSASNISLSNMTLANANQANGGTCDSSSNTGCNAAINLDAVTTVALTNVDITNVNQIGINGVNVAAFSLSNSVIQNCGNEGSEGCLRFSNLSGTSAISGSNLALKPVAGSAYNGERVAWIVNTSGTLNLTVSSSTFRDTGNSTNPGNGLEVFLRLTAIATINVSNSSFLRIGTIGLQVNTSDSSSASATVSGSTFDFDTAAFGRGVEFASSQTSTLNFRVNTSTIKGKGGVALVVVTGNTASSNGFIQNNTIIGTVGGFGSALLVRSSDQSRIKVEISDNIIDKQGADNGIFIDNGTANTTHTSRIDAIVLRNTITTNTLASNGINITALINQTICANVANNVVTELGTGGGGGQLSAFRGRASAPGATLYLQGFNTNVATTWINNGNTPANAARVIQSGTGTIAAPPGGACTPPTAFRPAVALAPSAESVVASDADAASEPAQTVDAATLAPNEPASAPAATNAPTVAARPAALLADTVPLSIGTLPAGLKITIIFDAVIEDPLVTTSSTLSNQASISGTNFSTVLSNDPDTVAANDPTLTPLDLRSSLTLSKSDGGASVVPGGVVAYSLTITNTITRPALTTVLTETVPVNTTFNAGASSLGWSCADGASAGTTCTLAVGNLVGNTTVTRTFAVRVVNPVAAGVSQISNTATVGDNASIADLTPADNTATDTTPVNAAPDLRISKTDGGVSVAPGGTVVYTLSYTNTGNQGATGISLSETVPANTTFTGTGWICLPANNVGSVCTRSVGALAGGGANGSATFTLTVINPVAAGVNQISNTATVSDDGANGADPNPANNTGSDTTPLNAAPALTLRKSDGGTTAIPGGTIVYTLSYTNTGNQGASGITLSETVPANTIFNPGASSAGWVCAPNANAGATCTLAVGALAAGGNVSRTFAVTVINAVPAGVSQISNTASVSDDGSNSAAIITATASDTTPLAAAPDLRISKSDGGATTTPGGTIVYTLNYTNTGNQGATGVVLSETVPVNTTFNAGASTAGWVCAPNGTAGSPCTLAIGALNAGSSGTAIFAVSVVSPVAAGVSQINNTATIADDGANGADSTPGNNTGTDTTPLNAAPDLTLSKTDGGFSAGPLDVIVYTVTITNTGNQGATGVTISETVPANTSFNAGASSAGWVCAPNANAGATCTLTVGTLNGGVTTSRTFAVTVVDPLPNGVNSTTNTATVSDDGTNGADATPGNNTGSDSTPLSAQPNLAMSKTDGGTTTTPGSTIAYTLAYTNTGTRGAAGVVITETVPLHTSFNAGASSAGWVCAPNNNAGSICTLGVGSLAGRVGAGSKIFAVTVIAAVPAGVNQISNTASIGDDGSGGADANPADNTASDTTPITAAPDLRSSKSDGGATTTPGGTIVYTLNYTNTGNQGATGVVLSETVPANTTFNAGASSAGWSCAAGSPAGTSCTLSVGGLNAGNSGSRTFAVTVVNPIAAGVSQISNTATIADDGANGADPTPANNTGADTTPITAAPILSLSKSDGGVSVAPGGTVVYTLSYTNTGNQGATGITLSETVPANTSFNAGASSAGWVCAPNGNAGATCTLSIGGLAGATSGSRTFAVAVVNPVAAGVNQISNTATISDDGTNSVAVVTATASDTTPIIAAPVLGLSKTDGGVSVAPSGTVVYTLSYTNTGNQGASGISLSETVPANTTFNAGASSAGWVCAPNGNAGATCTLSVGGLNAGNSGSRTFAVTVVNLVAAGVNQISNTATITDNGANSATASDTTPLAAAPDLRISKSDGGVTTTPGGTIVYTLNYTNTGNQGAAGVTISETVPANTSFNAGASSAGWSCAAGSPAGTSCTLAVGSLAGGGANGTAQFAVSVVNPIAAGVSQISNTATIADDGANGADPTPANNSASDTTPITAAPDLALTKSDGGVSAAPGDTINYTLTITNTGNQGATGVGLSETVPANTTFNPGASTAGWVCLPNTNAGATCTLAVGAVTTNVSAVFAVSVVNPVPAGVSQISNTASVADDGTNGADPTPANNSAADTTPLAITLDLSISKTVTPSVANAGDTITYTLRFTSTGDTLANGVRITDTLPSQITFVGSSTSGAPITQINGAPTLVWNADNLQPGATGIITLTATVNANVTTEQDVVNRVSIAHSQETAPANNSDSATFTINLAPTANAGGPYTVNEGATVVLTGAASTDPGNDPLIFAWDLDNNGAYETSGITVTFTNTADDAVYTVGLRVTDTEGATAATTTTITVQNIAPIVNAGADRSARPNEAITFSGAFTDPGVLDTHTIAWDFGDGGTTSGTLSPTHTYVNSGSYTVTLTITDDDDGVGVDTLRVNVRSGKVYLPLVLMMRPAALPDLVVQNISTTGTSISVVIKNEGTAPVTQALWVDLYFNPNPAPTTVNQIWQALGQYGMVWAVVDAALPLQPGQSLTLVSRDAYFRSDLSAFLAPIPVGTKVYVQVDSANDLTTYGAVLETHEASGGAYNNITGPFITTQAISIPPAAAAVGQRPDATLPQRPTALK